MPAAARATARESRRLREEVDEARRQRCDARPPGDEAEGVGRARAQAARPVVRQELRLVGRHVHVDGAVALQPLQARQRSSASRTSSLFQPSRDRLAAQHLEEQPRAAARGVLLLARDHEARAHRAAVEPPALADADAAQDAREGSSPSSSRNSKVRLRAQPGCTPVRSRRFSVIG